MVASGKAGLAVMRFASALRLALLLVVVFALVLGLQPVTVEPEAAAHTESAGYAYDGTAGTAATGDRGSPPGAWDQGFRTELAAGGYAGPGYDDRANLARAAARPDGDRLAPQAVGRRTYRTVDPGAPHGPRITLDEARAAAERQGIDTRSFDILYEPPTAAGYLPGFGFTRLNYDSSLARGPSGRFQVYLQDPALLSEFDAVQTIAHEITHIRAALRGANVFDHEYGEFAARRAGEYFR